MVLPPSIEVVGNLGVSPRDGGRFAPTSAVIELHSFVATL